MVQNNPDNQYDLSDVLTFKGLSASDKFCKFLDSLDEDAQIYFHNGSRYDVKILLENLLKLANTSNHSPVDFIVTNGSLLTITILKKNGKLLIIKDSCQILPVGLATLAKDFNVKHQKQEIGDIVAKCANLEEVLSDEMIEYNKYDVLALAEVMNVFSKIVLTYFDINIFNIISISSLSKAIFYNNYYNPDKMPLYTLPKKVHSFIQEAYRGGRCESFYKGKITKDIYHYDINSLYPYCGTFKMPVGKPTYLNNLNKITDIKGYLTRNVGFYKVIVSSPNNLAYQFHGIIKDNVYMFPKLSKCELVCYSEEILYGISIGYKYQLIDGYCFKEGLKEVCTDFFKDVTQLKQDAEKNNQKGLRWVFKIIANSGYGFFAFNKYNREVLKSYNNEMDGHLQSLMLQGNSNIYNLDGLVISSEKDNVLLENINIPLGACITANARILMHKIMHDIDRCGGKVYYTDTDSIFTDIKLNDFEMLRKYLPDEQNKLGRLSDELKGGCIKELILMAPKVYAYTDNLGKKTLKFKGLRFNDKVNKRRSIVYQKLKCYVDEGPFKFIEKCKIMRSNKTKYLKGDFTYEEIEIDKLFSFPYSKGKVLDDGSIVPFEIENWSA